MTTRWQHEISDGIRTLKQLQERSCLSEEEYGDISRTLEKYQLMVSNYYLNLIDWDDPQCPIRKQAIPSSGERLELDEELRDPVGDHAHAAPPLLVHRYPDRALLFPTLRCPMFCRFCFRKVLLNEEEPIRLGAQLDQAMNYLGTHTEIKEVILSGGDPLMLGDEKLEHLLSSLVKIPHVRRVRIHTRTPATLPMRFTPELLKILARHAPLSLVAHFNHPRELTPEATEALRGLALSGVLVMNQTVLLRDINNNTSCLRTLFEGLVDRGVKPYYLHHPDLTVGTHHFRVRIDEGLAIYRELRGTTSGIAIPQYVMEVPGGKGKVAVDSGAVQPGEKPGEYLLTGPFGDRVLFREPVPKSQSAKNEATLSIH